MLTTGYVVPRQPRPMVEKTIDNDVFAAGPINSQKEAL